MSKLPDLHCSTGSLASKLYARQPSAAGNIAQVILGQFSAGVHALTHLIQFFTSRDNLVKGKFIAVLSQNLLGLLGLEGDDLHRQFFVLKYRNPFFVQRHCYFLAFVTIM